MYNMFKNLCFTATLMLASTYALGDAGETGIAVIMAPETVMQKVSRGDLPLIFKYKRRFWPDGRRIQAVNLSPSNPVRRAFSQEVFGRSPEELDEYWRDMYFHGVLPPYVLASEEAVIRFVATTPGAIGYVSRCAVDSRVTVVLRLDGGVTCPR